MASGKRVKCATRSMFLFLVFISLTAVGLAKDYAVLFSGGVDARSNSYMFYESTVRMWDLLTTNLGYKPANIYVLAADGLNPAIDYYNEATRTYGNSDWSKITGAGSQVQAATYDNLKATLQQLNTVMGKNDEFYFWAEDHGAKSKNDDIYLCAWGNRYIADEDLASWVNPFKVKHEVYVFTECFGGGMVDDLNLTPGDGRFAAWAADWYESSWYDPKKGNAGWSGTWMDGIESGLRSTYDLGNYALINDPYGPYGKRKEHPGFEGDNFLLGASQISTKSKAKQAATYSLAGYYSVAKQALFSGDPYNYVENYQNQIPVNFAYFLGTGFADHCVSKAYWEVNE